MWKEEMVVDEGRVERAETEVDVWYLLVEVRFSVLEVVSLHLVLPLHNAMYAVTFQHQHSKLCTDNLFPVSPIQIQKNRCELTKWH